MAPGRRSHDMDEVPLEMVKSATSLDSAVEISGKESQSSMSDNMNRKHGLMALVAMVLAVGSLQSAKAQDPTMGFMMGYSLGQTQRFQTRLPTPPYFSIHPPVYYGKRYERPYGESPYAAWPMLQPSEEYRPQLKSSTGVSQVNPYCPPATESVHLPMEQPVAQAAVAPGKKVVIDNPFVGSDLVNK